MLPTPVVEKMASPASSTPPPLEPLEPEVQSLLRLPQLEKELYPETAFVHEDAVHLLEQADLGLFGPPEEPALDLDLGLDSAFFDFFADPVEQVDLFSTDEQPLPSLSCSQQLALDQW
jgi:hypothetical protein